MAKTLSFDYEGKTYTLQFTRRTVQKMEDSGFIASEVTDKPATMIPKLFAGAFLANHPFAKRDVIDKIFDCITNKETLLERLVEMYNEPLEAMIDEPEANEGNVTWAASW